MNDNPTALKSDIYITCDFHEQNSYVPDHLARLPRISLDFKELLEGDYILSECLCVERKTATDFAASIMDRRLFSQARKLKAEFSKPVIILEGNIFLLNSGIEQVALIGALSWLVAEEGISVLFSDGERRTAQLLATMARHSQEGLGYEIALRHDKPKDVRTLQQFLIEGLPGIAGSKAKALLSHFGSPHAIFVAENSELSKVPGIGKEIARRIREVVHALWENK
ncbi:MAG: ERCC4 domain-containing protein [Thermodesulfovibrionales bacterium]